MIKKILIRCIILLSKKLITFTEKDTGHITLLEVGMYHIV